MNTHTHSIPCTPLPSQHLLFLFPRTHPPSRLLLPLTNAHTTAGAHLPRGRLGAFAAPRGLSHVRVAHAAGAGHAPTRLARGRGSDRGAYRPSAAVESVWGSVGVAEVRAAGARFGR
eukprot:255097-Chlamydomonas_euryale.AAC.4